MKLSSENQLFLYDGTTVRYYVRASSLQDEVPGFVAGQPISLKVLYPNGLTYYQYYSGGSNWIPTAPSTVGSPGKIIAIRVQVLTKQDFLSSLPVMTMVNDTHALWVADNVQITGCTLTGRDLTIQGTQADTPVPHFEFLGTAIDGLGFNSGRTFLQFTVTDVFQTSETLRIYHNGHDPMYFAIDTGRAGYKSLSLISYDGTRLKFVQDSVGYTTTLYMRYPSSAYSLGELQMVNIPYSIPGYSFSYKISTVGTVGQLEYSMAHSSDTYSIGRIGAEIAYTIATEKFGLNDVEINEVSQGGVDLITADGSAVIQARLLMRTAAENSAAESEDIKAQLIDMVGTINQDFKYNPGATIGYVILSHADNNGGIDTIILEVEPP